jgi:LysR family glycine cleavage system transcriptional activator
VLVGVHTVFFRVVACGCALSVILRSIRASIKRTFSGLSHLLVAANVVPVRPPVPSLIDLEAFEAAARHGSFVAAAAEMHLSPSAVSHRVRELEHRLGASLFVRHARRIELTDRGRAFLPSVRKAFDELAMSTTLLFGSPQTQRTLRIRIPVSYAATVVAPRLHEFSSANPDVEIRLVSAIWADSEPLEDVDIEIRFGEGSWPGMAVELLHAERARAVWAQAFCDRYGAVSGLADLATLPRAHVIGFENLWTHTQPIHDTRRGPADVTVDTSLAAIELAMSGGYSTIVPSRFVARQVSAGELLTLPDGELRMSQAHYVALPDASDAARPDALRFTEWLRTIAE